jgi:hypothetical protein
MLPAWRLLSINTQNMTYCIRITDTPSTGAVVPPDWFGGIPLGSSLYPTEGYCLRAYSSSTLSMLKIVIFLIFFYCVFFTSKIYALNRIKYLITGILLSLTQAYNTGYQSTNTQAFLTFYCRSV